MASATVVLIILDSGFVALAFPEIEREFTDTSRGTLSWIFSGYFVALAGLMLVAGKLADRLGRRRVFLGGLLTYAFGALVVGAAPTAEIVIGARLVQGAGAAALTPVSLSLVLREFPPSRRSTAIGGWAVIGGSAGVLAPTLGAVVVEAGGWRAPFFVLAGLLVFVTGVGATVLEPDSPDGAAEPMDLWSVPLAVAAVGGLALGLSKGGDWGWGSLPTVTAFGVGAICTPIFLARSKRVEGALLDLSLFRIRSYAAGSAASVFTQVGFFAFFFTAPLFFTEVWAYSVLAAGLALALHQASSVLVGLPLGRLADRVGPKKVVAAGGGVAALTFLWLAVLVDHEPMFLLVIAPAFLIGGVATMANGALTTSLALRQIDDAALSRASSGYYVTRRLASGLGVVISAAILGNAQGPGALDEFRLVWLFVAACYGLSGAAALLDR